MLTKRDNYALGSAGLAIAGTPALGAYKITNALAYQIDGQTYQKAATDNIAVVITPAVNPTPITLAAAAIGASKITCMWIWINAAGSVFVEPAATLNPPVAKLPPSVTGSGYGVGVFEWPSERPGYALLGAVKVATNASGAFTYASTSHAAANQTVTYYNVGADFGVPITF
jgi:hypothetical protein